MAKYYGVSDRLKSEANYRVAALQTIYYAFRLRGEDNEPNSGEKY